MSEWFWPAFVAGFGFGIGSIVMASVGRLILKGLWHHKPCPRCEGIGLVDSREIPS